MDRGYLGMDEMLVAHSMDLNDRHKKAQDITMDLTDHDMALGLKDQSRKLEWRDHNTGKG